MSQAEGLDMNTLNLVIFLISFAMASGQEEDFSERNTPPVFQNPETPRKPENSSAGKPPQKNFKIPTQQHPAATPNRNPLPRSGFPPTRPNAAPHFAFSPNPTRTIYLSDHTGEYDLRLHNFRRGQPSDFQAALGAISAHILNQSNNREYVPYPPNGNRYDYYLRGPFGAEPPARGAHERGSRSDYDVPADAAEYRPGIPSEGFHEGHFDQEASRPFHGY